MFSVRRKYVGIKHHRELSPTLSLHDIGGEGCFGGGGHFYPFLPQSDFPLCNAVELYLSIRTRQFVTNILNSAQDETSKDVLQCLTPYIPEALSTVAQSGERCLCCAPT